MKMTKVMTIIVSVVLVAITALSLTACDANSVSIGVQTGTTGYSYVNGDSEWGFEGFDNITLKQYESSGLAVLDMLNGQIDWVMVDNAPAEELLKTHENKIKLIDIALTIEQYAFGVDKAQDTLLDDINDILKDMTDDGTLQDIYDLYNGGGKGAGVVSATKDLDKASTQLVVATNAEFDPYEYKEGGKFYGIDIDIMAYIADKLNLELVIEDMAFESVVISVGKNGVDVAAAGLTINASRSKSVNFTTPYELGAAQVLLVKSDDTTFDNCTTKEDVISILKSK